MLREVIELGRTIGKRPRGRKRAMMLDNLRRGINYDELKNKAQNREVWRNYMPTANSNCQQHNKVYVFCRQINYLCFKVYESTELVGLIICQKTFEVFGRLNFGIARHLLV